MRKDRPDILTAMLMIMILTTTHFPRTMDVHPCISTNCRFQHLWSIVSLSMADTVPRAVLPRQAKTRELCRLSIQLSKIDV